MHNLVRAADTGKDEHIKDCTSFFKFVFVCYLIGVHVTEGQIVLSPEIIVQSKMNAACKAADISSV